MRGARAPLCEGREKALPEGERGRARSGGRGRSLRGKAGDERDEGAAPRGWRGPRGRGTAAAAALTVWLAPHMRTLSSGSEARNSFTFWHTKCFFLVLVLLALRAEPSAAPTPPADEPPAQFEAMADPDRRRHRQPDRAPLPPGPPPPLPASPHGSARAGTRPLPVPGGTARPCQPLPAGPARPVSCSLAVVPPPTPQPLPRWFRPRLPPASPPPPAPPRWFAPSPPPAERAPAPR